MYKDEKIRIIVDAVSINKFIYDYTYRLSDNERGLKIVMLGDAMCWLEKIDDNKGITPEKLLGLWKKRRLPIDGQNKKCINDLYDLAKLYAGSQTTKGIR